jgi:serine/threonine protein kinase, bacterial
VATHRLELAAYAEPIPGYRLRNCRGRGGFAEVWQAYDPDNKEIALKFFLAEQTLTTVKELKILQTIQKLTHPNLLAMHQVWCIPGYIVVAMELAEGSLSELFDAVQMEYNTGLDAEVVCHYLFPISQAIDFLNTRQHRHEGKFVGWMHCDVKPSNLLMVGDSVKLADFGLCTPITGNMVPYQRWGTVEYVAPEIHRGMITPSSDQYSLAVTYYVLRTGRLPFTTNQTSFDRELSYKPRQMDLNGIDIREQQVLQKALSVRPDDRWSNSTCFLQAMMQSILPPGSHFGTTQFRTPH